MDRATADATGLAVYDPNACVAFCLAQFPDAAAGMVVAAVNEKNCGCALKDRYAELFVEVDAASYCDISCPQYANELCGGMPDYWGVFRDYDRLAFSGQGAYDPWRYVFYQVVTIEPPGYLRVSDAVPERYFSARHEYVDWGSAVRVPVPCMRVVDSNWG
jgi:hypothetical protein